MRIRRILVPTDFSDCSDHALHYAANLARDLGARVTVMHVLEPIIAGDIYGFAEISGLNAELKRSATRRIARNVARLQKRGIRSRGLIGSGRAATAIPRPCGQVGRSRSPQKTSLRDGLLGEASLFQRILVLLALELRANECGFASDALLEMRKASLHRSQKRDQGL